MPPVFDGSIRVGSDPTSCDVGYKYNTVSDGSCKATTPAMRLILFPVILRKSIKRVVKRFTVAYFNDFIGNKKAKPLVEAGNRWWEVKTGGRKSKPVVERTNRW